MHNWSCIAAVLWLSIVCLTCESLCSGKKCHPKNSVKEPSALVRRKRNSIMNCKFANYKCRFNSQCCSNYCHFGFCVSKSIVDQGCPSKPISRCKIEGSICSKCECCDKACINNVCVKINCEMVASSCTKDFDCCSGECRKGVCKDLTFDDDFWYHRICPQALPPGKCKKAGQKCQKCECCNKNICMDGICKCIPENKKCEESGECCSGVCENKVCTAEKEKINSSTDDEIDEYSESTTEFMGGGGSGGISIAGSGIGSSNGSSFGSGGGSLEGHDAKGIGGGEGYYKTTGENAKASIEASGFGSGVVGENATGGGGKLVVQTIGEAVLMAFGTGSGNLTIGNDISGGGAVNATLHSGEGGSARGAGSTAGGFKEGGGSVRVSTSGDALANITSFGYKGGMMQNSTGISSGSLKTSENGTGQLSIKVGPGNAVLDLLGQGILLASGNASGGLESDGIKMTGESFGNLTISGGGHGNATISEVEGKAFVSSSGSGEVGFSGQNAFKHGNESNTGKIKVSVSTSETGNATVGVFGDKNAEDTKVFATAEGNSNVSAGSANLHGNNRAATSETTLHTGGNASGNATASKEHTSAYASSIGNGFSKVTSVHKNVQNKNLTATKAEAYVSGHGDAIALVKPHYKNASAVIHGSGEASANAENIKSSVTNNGSGIMAFHSSTFKGFTPDELIQKFYSGWFNDK